MTELPAFFRSRFGFFISRLSILIGMVLVFTSVGAIAGATLCKIFFHEDISSMNFLNVSELDSNKIAALKLFQTLAGSIGMFLVPALLFPQSIRQRSSSYLKSSNPQHWFNWPIAFGLMLVSVPFVSWLYQFNQGLKFPQEWSAFEAQIRQMEEQAGALTKVFVQSDSLGMLFLNLLVVAVIPAICEEFFFRGVIQNFIRMVIYNDIVSIIFAAIIFSGFHGQFYGFLPRLALGIVLGFIYTNSGNIWLSVFAHFVNNALATIMAYVVSFHPDITILKDDYVFPWPISILSILMVIGLIWWHKKLYFAYLMKDIEKLNAANQEKINNS